MIRYIFFYFAFDIDFKNNFALQCLGIPINNYWYLFQIVIFLREWFIIVMLIASFNKLYIQRWF